MEKFTLDNEDKQQGVIKDDLDTVIGKMEEKAKNEEIFEKERKKFEKDMKEAKKKEKMRKLWQTLLSIFQPNTYSNALKNVESLVMIIFIDLTLLSILFSLLYGLYIIIIATEDFDWKLSLFKFGGSIIVCLIGILIQSNLSPGEWKNEDE